MAYEPRQSYIEGVLARGDRRLGDVIEAAFRGGARFDAWDEQFKYDLWLACLEQADLDPNFYPAVSGRARRFSPWSIFDCGVTDDFLWS
jgi:hypothetical protein